MAKFYFSTHQLWKQAVAGFGKMTNLELKRFYSVKIFSLHISYPRQKASNR